jgi:hypothetical protein
MTRRPGDAILGVAEIKKKVPDSTASITPARRLPARRDGRFTCRRRRRVRHPLATANRSAPYADRKQRRALAREAFTSPIGGHVASPAAEIRLYGADRVRKTAFIQSVALHSRASATGKSKPCSTPDVRRAFEAAAHDERRATLRTDWRRGIRVGGFARKVPLPGRAAKTIESSSHFCVRRCWDRSYLFARSGDENG